MNKQEFIGRLLWFAANDGRDLPDEYGHPDYMPARGETILAGMFAMWLDDHSVPEESGFGGDWTRDLPLYVVEAYADFASDKMWEHPRSVYKRDTGYAIPDLVDVYAGGIHRTLVAHSVCRLMPLLAEAPWLRTMLEVATGAQMAVIDQAWRRFVRVAYRKVMPRIQNESHRGNVGVFGTTKLLTFDCAGRVMFTFQRDSGQITYVADASDMYGNRSGPNAPGAPYQECVAMIEDVIAHWDIDKLQPSDYSGVTLAFNLGRGEADSLARTRNNLRATADQLAAAVERIDELDRQLQQAIDKRKGSLKITSDALNVVSAQAGKIYRLTEEVDSLRASLIDRDLRTAAYVATLANEEHGHGYARMASYACSELEQIERRTVARIVEWLRDRTPHGADTAATHYAMRIEAGEWKAK